MKMMKAILTIALTLALTITLTTHFTQPDQTQEPDQIQHVDGESLAVPTKVMPTTPKKKVSRFLAENKAKNPRAADHCHKDGDVCAATNTYCCNNKCVELHTDKNNCGRCKNKCKYTQSCCHGKCVNLSYDKRNCGSCGQKCAQYCIYGTCDYA